MSERSKGDTPPTGARKSARLGAKEKARNFAPNTDQNSTGIREDQCDAVVEVSRIAAASSGRRQLRTVVTVKLEAPKPEEVAEWWQSSASAWTMADCARQRCGDAQSVGQKGATNMPSVTITAIPARHKLAGRLVDSWDIRINATPRRLLGQCARDPSCQRTMISVARAVKVDANRKHTRFVAAFGDRQRALVCTYLDCAGLEGAGLAF
jgi:hypothetical protein